MLAISIHLIYIVKKKAKTKKCGVYGDQELTAFIPIYGKAIK